MTARTIRPTGTTVRRSLESYLHFYSNANELHGCARESAPIQCVPCLHEVLDAGARAHSAALDARYAVVLPPAARVGRFDAIEHPGSAHDADNSASPVIPRVMREQALALDHLPVNDVFLTRVLVERLHFVAADIKDGNVADGRMALADVQAVAEQLRSVELRLVLNVESMPVIALVKFLDSDLWVAESLLMEALADAAVLVRHYRHRYLATKQVQLGLNVSRVLLASGNKRGAENVLDGIVHFVRGQLEAWPFAGGSPPLPASGGPEHRRLLAQIDRHRERTCNAFEAQ